MKKLYTLSFVLLATVASFGQLTESFTGTGLLSANGWVNHNGATGQLSIAPGSLAYTGITTAGNKVALVAGNTEDMNKSLSSPYTTAAYYSVILNVPNTTGLTNVAAGDYSIAFGGGPVTATGAGTLVGRLHLKAGATPNSFNIGLVNTSGTGSLPSFLGTEYPVNTPIFIVVKYTIATNTAILYINPALNTTEPAASLTNTTGTTVAPTQIANIVLRQGGNATIGTGNVEFDEIKVSDNWAYVTSSTAATQKNEISGLSIYPNPATDGQVFITSNSGLLKNVLVFDVLGKQVLKANVTDQAMNIPNLKSGVYFVKVTEEGKTATRKLVINN